MRHDRVLVALLVLALTSCSGTEPASEEAEFIVQHRPWNPGERDAQIALMKQYNVLAPWATGLEDSLLPQDWISEVVRNPAYRGPVTAMANGMLASLQAPTSAGMTVIGLDLFVVDTTSPPQTATDSVQWLLVFWYNGTDPTYKGYTVTFSRTATQGPTTLNTTNFDAVNGTSGGGGGEIRPSTGEYWEATSGSMRVTANSARTASGSTITSGPFTGGTQRNGLMGGKLQNVTLSRILPTTGPTQNFTLDFSKAASFIPAARLECIFDFPCTSAAAALMASLRDGAAGEMMGESKTEQRRSP